MSDCGHLYAVPPPPTHRLRPVHHPLLLPGPTTRRSPVRVVKVSRARSARVAAAAVWGRAKSKTHQFPRDENLFVRTPMHITRAHGSRITARAYRVCVTGIKRPSKTGIKRPSSKTRTVVAASLNGNNGWGNKHGRRIGSRYFGVHSRSKSFNGARHSNLQIVTNVQIVRSCLAARTDLPPETSPGVP